MLEARQDTSLYLNSYDSLPLQSTILMMSPTEIAREERWLQFVEQCCMQVKHL